MKNKIIGILVCGLLIATCILPVCGVESVDNKINDSNLTLKQIKSMLCVRPGKFFISSELFFGFLPRRHAVQQFCSEQDCCALSLDLHRSTRGVQIEIDQTV
ncbi:Uncharacterised protein [uncultured archaeon]|nr:Uncharacterised protein [uncultured archaeon]